MLGGLWSSSLVLSKLRDFSGWSQIWWDEEIKKDETRGEWQSADLCKDLTAVSESKDGGNEVRTVGGLWRMTRQTARKKPEPQLHGMESCPQP